MLLVYIMLWPLLWPLCALACYVEHTGRRQAALDEHLLGYIVWPPIHKMLSYFIGYLQHVMVIHSLVIEIFQFGPMILANQLSINNNRNNFLLNVPENPLYCVTHCHLSSSSVY